MTAPAITTKYRDRARAVAARASAHFTDGAFEVDDLLPVTGTGDAEGVWVPCRLFVPWHEIED